MSSTQVHHLPSGAFSLGIEERMDLSLDDLIKKRKIEVKSIKKSSSTESTRVKAMNNNSKKKRNELIIKKRKMSNSSISKSKMISKLKVKSKDLALLRKRIRKKALTLKTKQDKLKNVPSKTKHLKQQFLMKKFITNTSTFKSFKKAPGLSPNKKVQLKTTQALNNRKVQLLKGKKLKITVNGSNTGGKRSTKHTLQWKKVQNNNKKKQQNLNSKVNFTKPLVAKNKKKILKKKSWKKVKAI